MPVPSFSIIQQVTIFSYISFVLTFPLVPTDTDCELIGFFILYSRTFSRNTCIFPINALMKIRLITNKYRRWKFIHIRRDNKFWIKIGFYGTANHPTLQFLHHPAGRSRVLQFPGLVPARTHACGYCWSEYGQIYWMPNLQGSLVILYPDPKSIQQPG